MKKANKKSTKGTKKVWKKGQSSSFNPKFNKFRLEAKKRAVFGNTGTGDLTVEKLAAHNLLTSEKQNDNDTDIMSIGGDTAVSAFTNCSLPTFNRFLQNWNSGSFLHKEMVAVLAAVTEILKMNGGKETETEYFAALMTTLDAIDTDEGVTAVTSLILMVVKRLHENVLKHQYDTCDVFIKLLLKYMNSEHGALLKNLLRIIYCFFKVNKKWSDSSCDKFKVLLEFATHHKPKVRRTAQQIICSLIVNSGEELSQIHTISSVVADFCIAKLENYGGPSAAKDIFYILLLLQETIGTFPRTSIKKICETILRVMLLSNSMVTSSCLKTLKGLFGMKPKPENLPADLNARIISALYDYQPNLKESQNLISWLQLMKLALINLKQLDEKLCIGHLPKFFFTTVKCWQSDREEVHEVVASTLLRLLYECVDPSGNVFQQYLSDDPIKNPMHKMFHYVEESLEYQYHKAWKQVLRVLATFFEVIGKHCYTVMLKCLQSLADLHDSYNFPYISDLEIAVGMAIQHIGPKIVLRAIPLQISGDGDKPGFPRSWLLPLLRDNIKKTELQFFVQYFMPLAVKLKQKVFILEQEQKIVESKLYNVICSQIWALLPGFCNEPTDLKECFKNVARVLGAILNEDPSLRMTVLSSLRTLINKNLDNDENKEELSRFSKNYLPILFNLYATEPTNKAEERVRLAVYETCKCFLQITNKELSQTFFEKAFEKLNSPESSPFMQQAMIDVTRAILPYVDLLQISKIYEYCKPLLKDSNHTTQKKSYRILNEICSSESESCQLFVKKHLEEIEPLLCGASSGLIPATRALRLNILGDIIKQLSSNEKAFVIAVIPEAVLCTKENSVKARAAAFNLLITIGNTMLNWQPTDSQDALSKYMEILIAGLGTTPHLMSASILAIGRVLYEFKSKIHSNVIHALVENMCLLLTSKSREIVIAALSFMKILFSVMSTDDLLQHVEFMVKSITSIAEDNQRHFRFKAKELFTRLVRKFGYEMISKLVPPSFQKQLTNIRKVEARKSRKRNANSDDEGSKAPEETKANEGFGAFLDDSDEEVLPGIHKKKIKRSHKRNMNIDPTIEEHGEDDIVDLMDPAINKRLFTMRPEKRTSSSADVFPISEDGRLIINDDDDAPKTKDTNVGKNERDKILSELGTMFKTSNKRKHEESDDEDNANNIPSNSVSRGIHRSLESNSKRKALGSEFKAKKAGGDVKKGKLDPYAYVPLNKQFLNKRKHMKMKGQFNNIVKGAKRGAKIGNRRKVKGAKRKNN